MNQQLRTAAVAWLITAMNYDVETRAAFDTIRSALSTPDFE